MAARNLTHRQRLEACLQEAPLDRPPVALWRHFPVDDQTLDGLASATLAFQQTYDFDLVKVTPPSSFCLRDWGVEDEWRGATEGTRDYTRRVIQSPQDWTKLKVLNPYAGFLGAQMECLASILTALEGSAPVVQTIFNPLAQAKNLAGGERLFVHLRRYPEAVHAGLRLIAETTRNYVEALCGLRSNQAGGISGIFYAVQHANFGLLAPAEYLEFGRAYDLQVLEPARSLWLNMLHLHGDEVMFDQFSDYPVAVINWHDRDTPPSLAEAKQRFPHLVCGGLQRHRTMVLGNPAGVIAEAHDALRSTQGRRFILGAGCVTPVIAPHANLLAARRSVEDTTWQEG